MGRYAAISSGNRVELQVQNHPNEGEPPSSDAKMIDSGLVDRFTE